MNEDTDVREEQADQDADVRDVARGMARERRAASRPRSPEDRPERVTEPRDRTVERADAQEDVVTAPLEANESDESRASLFERDRASDLRSRWSDVQGRFVDDPREAVKAADALVEEVIGDLSKQFSAERSRLESQWGRDQEVSTEDLRVALRRYRSFFERLLTI
jgi:hypothetical protein